MVGMADDGILILELYLLAETIPSGDDQKSFGEVPEQSEPTIIYLDQELASVALRVSPRDFLQLIGVDDPKQDRGEVTKVYDDGFVQLHMIDGVSVCVY